jgi:hypothetical protein
MDLVDNHQQTVNKMSLQDPIDLSTARRNPDLSPPLNVDPFNFLHVSGVLTADELTKSLVVLKKGAATRMIIGRSNPVQAYRRYNYRWSVEIPIIGFEKEAFSAGGDYGAIVLEKRKAGRLIDWR